MQKLASRVVACSEVLREVPRPRRRRSQEEIIQAGVLGDSVQHSNMNVYVANLFVPHMQGLHFQEKLHGMMRATHKSDTGKEERV